MRLGREFYTRNTLIVAKELLGKYIVRKYKGKLLIGKIVETEAYIGPKDKASHCYSKKEQDKKTKLKILNENWERIKDYVEDKEKFFKRILNCKNCKVTKRNLAEYLRGGHIYIYLIYGNYYQLNITTYKEGYPECVLIRSLEPVPRMDAPACRLGRDLHADLRGYYYQCSSVLYTRLSAVNPKGPGRLCKALHLDNRFWGYNLVDGDEVWLEDGEKIDGKDIVKSKRIGIDYAEEYKDKLWRFYIKNNKWVSRK
jgi:DNA-3-methyladenine glycosylase